MGISLPSGGGGGGGGGSVDVPMLAQGLRDGLYYRSGSYFIQSSRITVLNPGAVTPDRLLFFPFLCVQDVTIDRLAIVVTTAVAGNARLGLYTGGSGGPPTTLLVDAGQVSTGATGTAALTVSQALTAGTLYWRAAIFSSNPTVRTADSLLDYGSTGFSSDMSVSDSHPWEARAFGALPATVGTLSYTLPGNRPAIYLRAA